MADAGNHGSDRLYIVDPAVQVFDTDSAEYVTRPASGYVAGVISRTDNDKGFWWSPSNQLVSGITGTARPIGFGLSDPDTEANPCGPVRECRAPEPWPAGAGSGRRSEVIRRYDGPHALFYLDPPYHGCENDYGKGMFDRSQFRAMAAQLAGIEGRFIMSINDVPDIRDDFAGFHLTPVKTTYTIAKKTDARGERGELLISNFGIG